MSGHSKWSKVKHQKAVTDVAKAAAFTRASRAITVAVREGGGAVDPAFNFKLRLAIEKARDANMPKENIQRAIDKAKTDDTAMAFETYEGYGPFGVAILVETASDNNRRTVSSIKQALEYAGGSMASPGAVSYLFDRIGIVLVPKTAIGFDQLFASALEAGAIDVTAYDDAYEVQTNPGDLAKVRDAFERQGIAMENTELVMKPKSTVSLDAEQGEKISRLVSILEENDDVQKVFTNHGEQES